MNDVAPAPVIQPAPLPLGTIRYRVFVHTPTGRRFPLDTAWDGTGTPSAAYIPDLAAQYGIPAEEIVATDTPDKPDLTENVLPLPPLPPSSTVPPPKALQSFRDAASAVAVDPKVPASVQSCVAALRALLEERVG